MSIVQFINDVVFKTANYVLDIACLGGGLVLFISYPIYFFATNFKKYTSEKKTAFLLSQTITLFVVITFIEVIWALPETLWLTGSVVLNIPLTMISRWAGWVWLFSSYRLTVLMVAFYVVVRYYGQEHGETRWRTSTLLHIGVIIFGWFFYRWLGFFFVSIPLLWYYHANLHTLALIVTPVSNPDDKLEQKRRRNAFLSYTWGTQSPMTVIDGHSWQGYKPRINGKNGWAFFDFPFPLINNLDWRPGLIWTRSHQVVAVTSGTKFKRIDGPGVVFTSKQEYLDQVFDLRIQLRTKEIEVVSKDGIHFLVCCFTAFRLDNNEWPQDLYNSLLTRNPLLRGGDKLNPKIGSFGFSSVRVQATLGVTSTTATNENSNENSLVYWDQWVMNIVEDQTRKVISQKNLDEMWRPAKDTKFANAMDLIAAEIKENCEPILRSAGVLVLGARVENFQFKSGLDANKGELDEISAQQLATWKSEWDRKREAILSEAQAESERTQQEARAYAEAMLLSSIAEGIEKTIEIDPDLPRHVIAMRFLSALQDYIHQQPGGERRDDLAKEFKAWQDKLPGEK